MFIEAEDRKIDLGECVFSSAYHGIADIHDFLTGFSHDDILIDVVGRLIVEASMDDILGLCLLHRHFEMDDDELLVEFSTTQRLLSRPVRLQSCFWPVHPFIWRLSGEQKAVPMQWRTGINNHASRINTFFSSQKFFAIVSAMSESSCRYGLIQKSRVEEGIDGGKFDPLERTFLSRRRLVTNKISKGSSEGIQTTWYFRQGQSDVLASSDRYCDSYTRRVCRGDVRTVCNTRWDGGGGYGQGSVHDSGLESYDRTDRDHFHDRVSR